MVVDLEGKMKGCLLVRVVVSGVCVALPAGCACRVFMPLCIATLVCSLSLYFFVHKKGMKGVWQK